MPVLKAGSGRALLSGGQFTPARLGGLALWLRADSGVLSGNAASFTAASTQFLSRADNAALSMGAGVSFTLAGWVWFNGLGAVQSIASKSTVAIASLGLLGEYVLYKDAADKLNFYVSDGATAVTTPSAGAVTAGAWHFVVGRRDGTNISLRVDALAFADTASSVAAQDSTGAFVLGGTDNLGTTPLDGRMDAWGLWKRALTNTEVDQLYNGGAGLRYQQLPATLNTSLISWWDLEQPTGTRTDSVTASGNDLTSNNSVGITDGIALSAAVDGDAVRQWTDGLGITATQSTSTKRPLYKAAIQNGRPILRFDGIDDFLTGTGLVTTANGKTAFVVFNPVSAAGTNARVFDSTTGRLLLNHLGSTANTTGWFDNGTNRDTGAAATGAQVLTWSLTQPTGTMYRNGTSIGTATYGGTSATGAWTLAADTSGTTPLATDIAEFVFYNRALSTSERRQVEAYLGTKYAITVV